MSGNHRAPGPRPLFPTAGPDVSFIARDRIGRPLKSGQIVLFHQPFDLIAKIVAVSPVLHPNAPPGSVQVTLSVENFSSMMQGGMPAPNFVILQDTHEPAIQTTDAPIDEPQ